jgi:UDP-glucose:(glucosyl)LPS alpha-1,3-glucosyltransferase/UDP-D-galactose:(glucosyl)LPS alpha-1,3-D-galactosyltransferase/UDP-glucose:(galactosyl)LPS alpha-1,2-glucosyltransferase
MVNNSLNKLLRLSLDTEEIIKEARYYEHDTADGENCYHIVFGVDGNFIHHACMTIQSMIKQAETSQIFFHLITSEDTADIADNFRSIIAGTIHSIYTHQLSDLLFSNLPSSDLFSKAIYYRLLAPYLLEHEATILYLDADIICLNTFTAFYDSRVNSAEIALVVGEDEHLATTLATNIGLQGRNYFNSGMLLINVKRWLQENISEKTLSVLEKKGQKFKYMDQDALNIVLAGKVRFVEKKYNSIFMLGHKKVDYERTPPNDTVFLHYAGADKPWQKWNKQVGTQFYTEIYRDSPWSSYPFDKPKNDRQAKKMYKLLFREKKFLAGLYWYFIYYKFRYGN